MSMSRLIRTCLAMMSIGILAACGAKNADTPPPDLGDFSLHHNVVVADNATIGPLSREASVEAWEAMLQNEIQNSLGGYQSDHLYHLGVSVNAYVLAAPGVPLVISPKSVLVISVTLWDNNTESKVNPEPKQFTVFEQAGSKTFLLGSGLTQTKEEQMKNLSENAAAAIRKWLASNPEWFGLPPKET